MIRKKLDRFYQLKATQGHGTVSATLSLPVEVTIYLKRRLSEGDQIDGYRRFDRPLLASYSRSGTNWFRYIVESISGKPTPGQVRIYYGSDYVLDRAHRAFPVMSRYQRVILMLRDYRECLIRHNTELWERLSDVNAFLEDDSVFQRPDWYIENVAAFDTFQGDKLLIYYEDLLSEPDTTICALADFLDLDSEKTEAFITKIEEKYAESVSAYTKGGHISVTSKKQDFRYHANKHLTKEQQVAFDIYYQTNYPNLWEKYLQRYAVE